jgi:iron complex transport system ATP-binding protein
MIAVRGLTTSLGNQEILHGIDFSAGPGEFVAICGPNGAGKTTLLRAIAGLLPGGQPDPRRIAYVEQGARCIWPLTVTELASLGRIPWNDAGQAHIGQALTSCGIAHLSDRRVTELSGGQARRAMLARALATQAPILLLDEPVADLDPRAAHDIMALLASLARQGNCVVAVLHAVELAVSYATRMLLLAGGRVAADGVPGAILPAAAACFGMTIGQDPNPRLLVPISGVS